MSQTATNAPAQKVSQTRRMPVEQGNPIEDPRLFRRCLGQYGTGIAIITTQFGEKRVGVTVNSFASVSLNPPLVLWSISNGSRSFPTFKQSGKFAVNVLSSSQIELARHFSSNIEDKFADISWFEGEMGTPLIEGCIAHYECGYESQFEGGDHTILVGRAQRVSRYAEDPLLFTQGQYSIANSHPDVSPNPEVSSMPREAASESNLVPLIFDAYNVLSTVFDEQRRAEGVNIAVARVLASVYDSPGIKLDQIARETYLGQRDTEDAISELATRELLIRDEQGELSLTDLGRRLRESIRHRWQNFQDVQVAGIGETDLRVALRTLKRLISQNGVS